MSQKYKLNKTNLLHIGKVFAFLLASTAVAFLVDLLPQVELGSHAWLIPFVNLLLVSAKEWLKEHKPQ